MKLGQPLERNDRVSRADLEDRPQEANMQTLGGNVGWHDSKDSGGPGAPSVRGEQGQTRQQVTQGLITRVVLLVFTLSEMRNIDTF